MKLSFRRLLILLSTASLLWACSDNGDPEPEPDPGPDPDPAPSFTAPSYPDDYRAYATWDLRAQWGPYNVHDPSMEKDGDYYYIFGTDASYGNEHTKGGGHYLYRRSKDLVNWEFRGFAFPQTPSWVLDSLNTARVREGREPVENNNLSYGYWAPCVHKVGNVFRMYYSIFVDDIPITYPDAKRYDSGQWDSWTERAFIGWAEAASLDGPWTDKGMVAVSTTDGNGTVARPDDGWNGYWAYNAIDPTFIEDAATGAHWLIFGSWHTGMAGVELDRSTGRMLDDPYDYNSYTRIAKRGNSRWQGFEAPEMVYNEKTGYYYLFLAYDALELPYNTRVVRSKNITGLYTGSDGADVTAGAEAYPVITHPYRFGSHIGWQGISHCCVYYDEQSGKWFYASQGRPAGTDGNIIYCMVLHIHEIVWTHGEEDDAYNGWPIVVPERYAAVPQTNISAEDIEGLWEVVMNSYNRDFINNSMQYNFRSNGNMTTATGSTVLAKWTYDSAEKVITLKWTGGNTDRLYVQDALDWEAARRVPTITFTGLTAWPSVSGSKINTLWGKKIDG